jgi:predicted phage terminase large subunit-like protein
MFDLQNLQLPELTDIQRERKRRRLVGSFTEYVREAWDHSDPAPLLWGKHVEAICDHLQAVSEGKIRRLLINIPPGHAKSMLVSVLWPTWNWARNPAWQVLSASYALNLAERDATKARRLIEGEWFKGLFAQSWGMAKDQNQKLYYENTAKGFRVCLSVGGPGTGYRGDCQIVDDPLNAKDATSKIERENAVRWFTETMSSRLNNQEIGTKVVIMQRLHDDDLTGYLLKASKGEWQHLCLPSEFEPARKYHTVCGTDWRKVEGEVLFPQLYPKKILEEIKRPGIGMGSIAFAGQHQQRPMPATGGIIQAAWLQRRWVRAGEKAPENIITKVLPERFDEIAMFTDAAFKDTETSDRVAIGVWGRRGPDLFLLDMRWGHMDFTATLQAITDLRSKWVKRGCRAIKIEDKANGTAIISVLKKTFPGIIPLEPEGGKEARVIASTPTMESGNLWLPFDHPQIGDAVDECLSFPRAKHDDFPDMMAYAINDMAVNSDLAYFNRMSGD